MLLEAPGFARSMLTGNNNPKWMEKEFGDPSLDNRNDEHTIGTTLGKKDGIVVNIIITHENFDAKNENRNIIPEVDPRVFGAPCHSKYALTVKLAPIIRAAVDYYLDVFFEVNCRLTFSGAFCGIIKSHRKQAQRKQQNMATS